MIIKLDLYEKYKYKYGYNIPIQESLSLSLSLSLSIYIYIYMLYLFISDVTCANLPVSCIVLTFQNPILVLSLALRTSTFLPLASFRLSPMAFIPASDGSPGSPSCPVVSIPFVAVSVTYLFLQDRVVLCWAVLNAQPGGPVDCSLSGLYPSTCPAWGALGVIETHKLPDHYKVAIQQGVNLIKRILKLCNVSDKIIQINCTIIPYSIHRVCTTHTIGYNTTDPDSCI